MIFYASVSGVVVGLYYYYYYLLFILFIVRCGSLMGPCRLLAITRKILPQPIWRQKPCECMGKRPCLRLTPRQGKTHILSSSSFDIRIGVCLPMLYQRICKV